MSVRAAGESGFSPSGVFNGLPQQGRDVREQAPQFAEQIRDITSRFAELNQTLAQRVEELAEQDAQIDQLEEQLTQIEGQHTLAVARLQDVEERNLALVAEAEKMKLVATGTVGFAAGLGVGLVAGVTGPKILICGAGGSIVFLTGRVCYTQLRGD